MPLRLAYKAIPNLIKETSPYIRAYTCNTSMLTAYTNKHSTLSQVWTTYLVQCRYISVANMYVASVNFIILCYPLYLSLRHVKTKTTNR